MFHPHCASRCAAEAIHRSTAVEPSAWLIKELVRPATESISCHLASFDQDLSPASAPKRR
jgi:hypothetical protein